MGTGLMHVGMKCRSSLVPSQKRDGVASESEGHRGCQTLHLPNSDTQPRGEGAGVGCRGNLGRILGVTPFEKSLPEGGWVFRSQGFQWGWVESSAGPLGSREPDPEVT